MKVTVKYLGRTMELFGLPPNQKEETIHFNENALYKDVLEKIKEKFLRANKNRVIEKYDIFNDVMVISDGRIIETIKEETINHPEVIIAPLIAGG